METIVVFAVFVCALVGLFGGSQISFNFILPGRGDEAPDPDADVDDTADLDGPAPEGADAEQPEVGGFVCDSPAFVARVRDTAHELAARRARPTDVDYTAAREIELLRDPSGSCESKLAAVTDVEETSDTPASASPEGESA